jgi:hypothetical protein
MQCSKQTEIKREMRRKRSKGKVNDPTWSTEVEGDRADGDRAATVRLLRSALLIAIARGRETESIYFSQAVELLGAWARKVP